MAGKSDIEAGAAYVRAYVKNSELQKGCQVIRKELQDVGLSVMKVGGLITGVGTAVKAPIMAAVNQFVSMGTELQNISRRTGLGVQSLAEFKHAAEQTGASLGDIEGASKSVTKNIADAAMGGQGAAIALSRLGLTAAQLKTQLPEEQLQTISDRLKDIKDPAQQAALATQLLGGTNLLPMIGQLGALRQEARDLGLAPSEKAVTDAANMGRMIKRALSGVSAAIFEIGAAVGPTLFPIGEAVIRIVGSTTKWIRENQEIVRTVAKVAGIIVAVGGVITGIGAAIFGVGTAFGAVATIATTVAGAIAGILTIVSTLAGLIAPVLVPLGLALLAIGGLTAALLRSQTVWNAVSTTAKNAMGGIIETIAPYVEIVKTTIGGIVDALLSGQIGLAGQIAMTALRLAFEIAKLGIVSGWLDLRNKVLNVWDSIAVAAAGAMAFIGSLWTTIFNGLAQTPFFKSINAGWEGFRIAAKFALDYVLSYIKGLIAAMNLVSKLLWKTVEQVAVAMPAVVAVVQAGGANAEAIVGPDITQAVAMAGKAAKDAMVKEQADRDAIRDERKAQADLWKREQQGVIDENRAELERLDAEGKAARAALVKGGAGDKAVGRVGGGDIAAGAALRASVGSFSGAALQAIGNDGGIARKQLNVAQEQRDIVRACRELLEKSRIIGEKQLAALGMGP